MLHPQPVLAPVEKFCLAAVWPWPQTSQPPLLSPAWLFERRRCPRPGFDRGLCRWQRRLFLFQIRRGRRRRRFIGRLCRGRRSDRRRLSLSRPSGRLFLLRFLCLVWRRLGRIQQRPLLGGYDCACCALDVPARPAVLPPPQRRPGARSSPRCLCRQSPSVCLPNTLRPMRGTSAKGVDLAAPLAVTNSTVARSVLGGSTSAAVSLPVRSATLWATMPPPLRPWLAYSASADRLANPVAVIVSRSPAGSTTPA